MPLTWWQLFSALDHSAHPLGIQSLPDFDPASVLVLLWCGSSLPQLIEAIMFDSLHAIDLQNFD
jgi:hypothetical protein